MDLYQHAVDVMVNTEIDSLSLFVPKVSQASAVGIALAIAVAGNMPDAYLGAAAAWIARTTRCCLDRLH